MDGQTCIYCNQTFCSLHVLAGHVGWCAKKLKQTRKSISDTTGVLLSNNMGSSVDTFDATSNKSKDLEEYSVYDDLFCAQHTESAQPADDYLNQQLENIKSHEYICNKISCDHNFLALLKVYIFGSKKQLSEKDMKDFLDVLSYFVSDQSTGLTEMYNAVKKILNKQSFNDQFVINEFIYEIPRVFTDEKHILYKGHSFNVMSAVADMLLTFDENDINYTFNDINENIFQEPATALEFQKMDVYVKQQYGEDYYPLALTISTDGLALNKVGSRGAKPVYVQIASAKMHCYWSKKNIRCIGFAPEEQVY